MKPAAEEEPKEWEGLDEPSQEKEVGNPGLRPGGLIEHDQPMTDFLVRPYVCAIIAIAVILFLAVDELEPNCRIAFFLHCAILATGTGAIVNQLMS